MSEIVFKPIGRVKAAFSETDVRAENKDLVGDLEIYADYEPALAGIDGYSHLFVLAYFDRLRPDQIGPLQVKPRRLVNRGFKLEDLPLLGVFALDSPTRPNPIGLTLVRLIERNGRFLKVSGLDLLDGTPILDIKGYRPTYRVDEFTVPEWYKKLQDARGHI
jgi:tRNA-Thr(GGU) m(6)t(6)A37 methyltransferase TsaA